MSRLIFFDLETDSLLDSKEIKVVGWWEKSFGTEVKTTTDYEVMKELFSQDAIFVGHNIYMFDFIIIKKILGVSPILQSIDTLALSNYLRNNRPQHSLASYQEEVNVAKVNVDDWVNAELDLLTHRVTEDVKITVNLFHLFQKEFKALYGDADINKLMLFISSYYRDYHVSHYNPFIVDETLLDEYIDELTSLEKERTDKVEDLMPPVYTVVCKPKTHKKDGTLSEAGKKWFKLLEEYNLPLDVEEAKVIKEPPNASSDIQVKDWLLSLGWKPTYFKDGAKGPNSVPQIRTKEKELCPNIVKLNIPETVAFKDLSVISHRLGNLKRIKENTINGSVYADIGGLTNTLRIRHRTLVNLTKVSAQYGKYERGVLGCAEDEVLLGSDLSSLEDFMRANLTCNIDPSVVDKLLDKTYDSHLDMAVVANLLSQEDVDFYKEAKKRDLTKEEQKLFDNINDKRQKAKTTNYASLYGIGAAKLAKELKISQRESQNLIDAYWSVNWSVKEFERSVEIKHVGKQMWAKNPLNGLYYSLRGKKDIFSLINQSSGAYVHKLWINKIYEKGVGITGQFHDEIVLRVKLDRVEEVKQIIIDSLDEVNKILNLHIPIKCEVKVGKVYLEIH